MTLTASNALVSTYIYTQERTTFSQPPNRQTEKTRAKERKLVYASNAERACIHTCIYIYARERTTFDLPPICAYTDLSMLAPLNTSFLYIYMNREKKFFKTFHMFPNYLAATHTHAYIHTHTYARTYTRTNTFERVPNVLVILNLFKISCSETHSHTHTHTRTHTNTHAHTQTHARTHAHLSKVPNVSNILNLFLFSLSLSLSLCLRLSLTNN